MAHVLSMDEALIGKLNKLLEINLDKEHFGVEELAQEVGLSRSQLHRKLKYLTNKPPSRYIREFRLKKAMVMLQNNEATASEIAYRVGFNSPTYFNKCFHDYYGYPPGEVKFRDTKNDNLSKPSISVTIPRRIKKIRVFNRRIVWFNSILIILLSVFGYKLYQNYKAYIFNEMATSVNQQKSIAILPFKNLSNDIENQYFADGLAGAIQNNLNKISNLRAIPSLSMEKYRNTNLTVTEIGKALDVSFLLEGSVQKYGDSIRIITSLINARENKQLHSFIFDWEYKNIFEIQSTIAIDIAKQLDISIDPVKLKEIKKLPTENLEAYNSYIRGRFLWHRRSKEDLINSIDYFEQAIGLDSNYVKAYVGLADSHYMLSNYYYRKAKDSLFAIAKENLNKALSLDKNNAEAHATLGATLVFNDYNWVAAEKEFKLAIKLNPNYATAHEWYADLLNILGRNKEAREQIDLALELNPFSWMILTNSSYLYINTGQFVKAISEAKRAKEVNKYNIGPSYAITNANALLGRDDEAIAEWEEWITLAPYPKDEALNNKVREAFKKSGMKGFYRVQSDNLIKQNIQFTDVARMLAFLGENDRALHYLELAYERDEFDIIFIKNDYSLRNLRNEPSFLVLLKKLNLGGS